MESIFTYKRVGDRIIKTEKPRYVETGKKPNYNTSYALKKINNELKNMEYEIKSSTKSSSSLTNTDDGSITRNQNKSTFPKFMGNSGISSGKDFLKVLSSSKGIRFNRLKEVAIDRLNNGYSNEHGYDTPNLEFRKKTGQVYDNKNVIFRRIRGRLIPIKVKLNNRYDLKDEAPF